MTAPATPTPLFTEAQLLAADRARNENKAVSAQELMFQRAFVLQLMRDYLMTREGTL